MNRDFGKKTKGCFSSKARFSAVSAAFCSSKEIVTAHRAHGVCPARLAVFFSEERGCAALSREEEAARVVAADAASIVVSSAASEGIRGEWGVELPPVPVSRWGPVAGGGPAPRGDAPAEERRRPSGTEVTRALQTRAGWTTVRDGGDGLTRSEDWRYSLMGCTDRGRRGGIRNGGDWHAKNSGA